jgi:Flp pilus assembly protein TadD
MTAPARSTKTSSTRLFASVAVVCGLALANGGCMTTRSAAPNPMADMASAVPTDQQQAQASPEWHRAADAWGERYRANPKDPVAAINYAQALRVLGQRAQALSVLEAASIQHPKSMQLLGAYGRALADVGNYQQALDVLGRAHTPDQPDWHILSAQGAVLDQMGRHEEAQRYYATALKIVPEEPTVLSNLGLSYALARNLPQAETVLRRAVTRTRDPRVRQNLALVLGLQGRFAEAEQVARADLPPPEAAANVAYLRAMLAQNAARNSPQPQPHQSPQLQASPPPSQSWFAPVRG